MVHRAHLAVRGTVAPSSCGDAPTGGELVHSHTVVARQGCYGVLLVPRALVGMARVPGKTLEALAGLATVVVAR